MKPTIDQIEQALRACMVDEPQEKAPCESCYLFRLQNDGRMSTDRSCFEHLVLDTLSVLQPLRELDGTPLGRFLRHPEELAKVLAEAVAEECNSCPAFSACGGNNDLTCEQELHAYLTSKEDA